MEMGDIIKAKREEMGLTQDELGKMLGVNKAAVNKWESGRVQNLKRQTIQKLASIFNIAPSTLFGWEDKDEMKKNSTKKGVKIPVLGKVIAGVPIEAIEDILDYEEITEDMAAKGDYFALKVQGDSMEPVFYAGDIVIIRQQQTADSGDIVIAMVNGDESTIKKLKLTEDGLMLIPANPAYEPMYYTKTQISSLPVQIIGKVVELRRSF